MKVSERLHGNSLTTHHLANTSADSLEEVRNEFLSHTKKRLCWFLSLVESQPDLSHELERIGIVDLDSFRIQEYELPAVIRLKVAHFRYEHIVGNDIMSTDILDNLEHTASWLLETAISELGLSVRPTNILGTARIFRIGDLVELGSLGVLRLRNMGNSSYSEIKKKVTKLFLDGTLLLHNNVPTNNVPHILADNLSLSFGNGGSKTQSNVFGSFDDCWVSIRNSCDDRDWEILKCRSLDAGNNHKTLTEIGRTVGLSRERVRQIESRVMVRILRSSAWSIITHRVKSLLHSRNIPLTVTFIDREDDWFVGLEYVIGVVAYLLQHDSNAKFHLLDLGGQLTFTTISSADWQDLKKAAVVNLQNSRLSRFTRLDLYDKVVTDVQYLAPELAEILWIDVADSSVWATDCNGDQTFLTTDTSVGSLIRCVLELSPTPLHYTTIHEEVNNLECIKKYELYRIHNVLVDSFILYGAGVYGLEKHCPLTEHECELVASQLEVIIKRGPTDKQWHSHELLDILKLEKSDYQDRLTAHIISHLLSKSILVVALRRMVWGLRGQWNETADARIDVSSIVSGILISAGGPLTTKEIRERALELRGLSNVFQVHSKSPVIQIGPRLWGIEGRDVNVDLYESLISGIRLRLLQLLKPIHFSNMRDLVPENFKVNLYTLNVICRRNRIRLDQGYYLSLQEWDTVINPVVESVVSLLSRCDAGISVREIHGQLELSVGHHVEKQYLSDVLQDIGAVYDDGTRLWYPRETC